VTDAIRLVEVRRLIAVRLEPAGWRVRAGDLCVDVAKGVVGKAGLNYANVIGQGIRINPIIGVRHDVVERVVAELRKVNPSPRGSTVSVALHTLMPAYHDWEFIDPIHIAGLADQLAAAIARYGMPFIASAVNLEQLLLHLDLGHGHGTEYNRPVVLALLGRVHEARAATETLLESLIGRDDLAAEDLRPFANRLLEAIPQLGLVSGGSR
jgi:hypothetical protein